MQLTGGENSMNKTTKILLVSLIVVGVAFSGALFFASQKLKNLDLVKLAKENIEKSLPGAKANITKIDYSLGASIEFKAENTSLTLKRNGTPLIDLKDIVIKIPLWAILTGGGNLQVDIDNPKISFVQYSKTKNNWLEATGGSKKRTPQSVEAKSKSMQIPRFLAKSTVNISFRNISVNYRLADKSKGELKVAKFLIKNLNLKKETAFEIVSRIESKMASGEKLSLDAMLIGQANLHQVVEGGDLKSKIMITLNKLSLPGLKHQIGEVKLDLNVEANQKGDGVVVLAASSPKFFKLDAKVAANAGNYEVTNIQFNTSMAEAMRLTGFSMPELKVGETKLYLEGNLKATAKKEIIPDLNFKTQPAFVYKAPEKIDVKVLMNGSLVRNQFNVKVSNSLLGGTINLKVRNSINLSKPQMNPKKMPTTYVDIVMAGLNVKKSFIRKIMYPEGKKVSSLVHEARRFPSSQKKIKPMYIPSSKISFKAEAVKIGSADFSANGLVIAKGTKIGSDNFRFHFGKGDGKLIFNTALNPNGFKKTNLKFTLNKLDMSTLSAFLPASIDGVEGIFSGLVKGWVNTGTKPTDLNYKLNVNVKATNGKIKGINLTQKIKSLVSNIPMLKKKLEKKNYKVSDEFERFIVSGDFKSNLYQLKTFHFIGIRNTSEFKGNGKIIPAPHKGNGEVYMTYKDLSGAIAKELKKNIGREDLPMRLVGNGFNLKPDYGYTMKKIAKSAVKSQATQKVKKKAKDSIKKVIDKNKGQLKKMFKGLF